MGFIEDWDVRGGVGSDGWCVDVTWLGQGVVGEEDIVKSLVGGWA